MSSIRYDGIAGYEPSENSTTTNLRRLKLDSLEVASLSGVTEFNGGEIAGSLVSEDGAQTLSNKALVDDSTHIIAEADETARLSFNVGNTPNTETVISTENTISREYTIPDVVDAEFVMTEGNQMIGGVKTFTNPVSMTITDATPIIDVLDPTKILFLDTDNAPDTRSFIRVQATTDGDVYSVPDSGTADFVMTEGAQTINGDKTFTGDIVLTDTLNITNSADATKSLNFDLTGNTGGAKTSILTENTVSHEYTIPDVNNADFVMTEGAQTINGDKEFTGDIVLTDALNITNSADATKSLNFDLTGNTGGAKTSILTENTTSHEYTIPDVNNADFVMTEGTQTINGDKSFAKIIYDAGGNPGDIATRTATGEIEWTTFTPELPPGTANQILVNNGASWVASSSIADSTVFTAGSGTGTLRLYVAGLSGNKTIETAGNTTATYTIPDATNSQFVMSEGTQTVGGNKTFSGITTLNDNLSIYNAASSSKRLRFNLSGNNINSTTTILTENTASHEYTIPDVDNAEFVMTAGAQTINGNKTFTGETSLTDALNIANSTDATKSLNFDLTGNTGGAKTSILTENTVSHEYTIPDVDDSQFVMTEGAQTINGDKSFAKIIYDAGGNPGDIATRTATGEIEWSAPPTPLPGGIAGQLLVNDGSGWNPQLNITDSTTIVDTDTQTNQLKFTVGHTGIKTIATTGTTNTIYTIPDTSGNSSFVMTAGNQSISGHKQITGGLTVNDYLSFGIRGTINPTSYIRFDNLNNSNITVFIRTVATTESIYMIPNVGNSSFVMTAGNQSIAGVKTFTDTITFNKTVATPEFGLNSLLIMTGSSNDNLANINAELRYTNTGGTDGSASAIRAIATTSGVATLKQINGVYSQLSNISTSGASSAQRAAFFADITNNVFAGNVNGTVSAYQANLAAGNSTKYGFLADVAASTTNGNYDAYGAYINMTGGVNASSQISKGLFVDMRNSASTNKFAIDAWGVAAFRAPPEDHYNNTTVYITGFGHWSSVISNINTRSLMIQNSRNSSGVTPTETDSNNYAGTHSNITIATGADMTDITGDTTAIQGSIINNRTAGITGREMAIVGRIAMHSGHGTAIQGVVSLNSGGTTGNKHCFMAQVENNLSLDPSSAIVLYSTEYPYPSLVNKTGMNIDLQAGATSNYFTHGVAIRITGGNDSSVDEQPSRGLLIDMTNCDSYAKLGIACFGKALIQNTIKDNDKDKFGMGVATIIDSPTSSEPVGGIRNIFHINNTSLAIVPPNTRFFGSANNIYINSHLISLGSFPLNSSINCGMYTIETNDFILGMKLNNLMAHTFLGYDDDDPLIPNATCEIIGLDIFTRIEQSTENCYIYGSKTLLTLDAQDVDANYIYGNDIRIYNNSTNLTNNIVYGIWVEVADLDIGFSNVVYAIYAIGDVHIQGNLSKTSGTFLIDHPQAPAEKSLSHSFVEAPEYLNIYRGNVITGEDCKASISLPDYFEALNIDYSYQLTVIGAKSNAYVIEEVKDNKFVIETDLPNVKVSWLITGMRNDMWAQQNPLIVEKEKPARSKGKYWNPEAFGLGKEYRIH